MRVEAKTNDRITLFSNLLELGCCHGRQFWSDKRFLFCSDWLIIWSLLLGIIFQLTLLSQGFLENSKTRSIMNIIDII
jgi:hypothetical protein